MRSEITVIKSDNSPIIKLNATKVLGYIDNVTYYEATQYVISSENSDEIQDIYSKISAIKNSGQSRASGSEYDYAWFYGSSVCIGSTIYYNTYTETTVKFGKVSSVYVQCSANSGTSIDTISIYYGECGYAATGGYVQLSDSHSISNYSYTYFPSSWPYIFWDSSVGSATGATVTVTVHRGTTEYRQFSFLHNIIG